jgi:hypothetical protein
MRTLPLLLALACLGGKAYASDSPEETEPGKAADAAHAAAAKIPAKAEDSSYTDFLKTPAAPSAVQAGSVSSHRSAPTGAPDPEAKAAVPPDTSHAAAARDSGAAGSGDAEKDAHAVPAEAHADTSHPKAPPTPKAAVPKAKRKAKPIAAIVKAKPDSTHPEKEGEAIKHPAAARSPAAHAAEAAGKKAEAHPGVAAEAHA